MRLLALVVGFGLLLMSGAFADAQQDEKIKEEAMKECAKKATQVDQEKCLKELEDANK